MWEYMLERKEPYIAKSEQTRNRTHQSHRWRQVAKSKDLQALKDLVKGQKGYRIVNWDTLDVVYEK